MRTITGRRGAVAAIALGCALGALGCLSDDTVAPPTFDAGLPSLDGGVVVLDASGAVDGTPGDHDAADAGPEDAGVDAPPPPPTDSGVTGTATLAAGASVAKSGKYTLIGTVGPATAPVLRSSKYRLVGGMAAATPGP